MKQTERTENDEGDRKTDKKISLDKKKQVTTDKIHTADVGDQTAVSFRKCSLWL